MNKSIDLIEEEDYWVLPFSGMEVNRCCISYGLQIELLAKEYEASISIGDDFILRTGEKERNFSLEKDITAIGGMLSILHKTIDKSLAWKNGRIELCFSDGSCLLVDPDPNHAYEAWEVAGPSGILVVCMPSGGLAIWNSIQ